MGIAPTITGIPPAGPEPEGDPMRRLITATLTALLLIGLMPVSQAQPIEDVGTVADRSAADPRRDALLDRAEAGALDPDAPGFASTAFATDSCIPDANGDTYPSSFGKADILSMCAFHGDDSALFKLTLRTASNPATDANWIYGITGWGSNVDIDDDMMADGHFLFWNDGSEVYVDVFDRVGEESVYVCSGEVGIDGATLNARISTACLGGAAILNVDALMFYDSQWDDPEAPIYDDALDGVTRTAPGAPQSPSPPPPTASPTRESVRLQGADRIGTAVEISRYQFPNGASEVYLSRSDEFADSIASGSLTRGPVLLVPSCGTVPAMVLDEVRRLGAARIVALGGTGAVCDDVVAQVVGA